MRSPRAWIEWPALYPAKPKLPLIAIVENKDVIRGRAYSQQPPTIPHQIDGDPPGKNANRCLACHARSGTADGGTVPIGVSRYLIRDSVTPGSLSPGRDMRTQRHVTQADAKPLVGNTFTDREDVRVAPGPAAPHAAGKKQGHAMFGLIHYGPGFPTLGGFVAGVVFLGARSTRRLKRQQRGDLHELSRNARQHVRQFEIQDSSQQLRGMRAICSDCHVP